jgi:alkylhydroperoxidase/carboxymuconolactone decarboxylase family protein YurZ
MIEPKNHKEEDMSRMDEIETRREKCFKFLNTQAVLKEKFMEIIGSVYSDGVLDAKTKRLAGICGGLLAGRAGCILGQTDKAVNEGATAEEILEICAVAMCLGGTGVWSDVFMIVEYLEENGLIE